MIRIGHALLLILLLSGTSVSQAADIEDGLFAWYPFDDGAIDKTGNVEPVGTGRGLQIVAGKFGGAVHLDGKSYVTIPVDLNPDVIPDTTISMWVKTDPPPDDPALAKQLPNALFVLSESIGLSNLGNDSTYFYARSLNNSVVGPKHVVRRGQWQHVALVRWIEDRPGRDGNKIPHVVSRLHSGGRMTESAVPFKGQDMHVDLYLGTGSPRYEHMFRGAVDELRIYDRALSEEEIGLLATANASAFPRDNFDPSDAAFPGDNFDPSDAAFPGDNFDPSDTAFPGDNFDPSDAAFPGDNFERRESTPTGNSSTTDTSALGGVSPGDVTLVDMAVDNPTDDNRDAATPYMTLPDANDNPSIMPPNPTADDFQERMDDPEFQDSLKAVDWNVKGMVPLTQEEKANIYPGSIVTVKIRVEKDDPANKIPDIKLVLKGAQSRVESVPVQAVTSEQEPTATREIPMTITIPQDFVFDREGEIGTYFADTWLLTANGFPLQDTVTDNNSRRLSIQVQRPPPVAACGETQINPDGTRSTVQCLVEEAPNNALNDWTNDAGDCQTVADFVTNLWPLMDLPVNLACGVAATPSDPSPKGYGERFLECTTNHGALTNFADGTYARAVDRAVQGFNWLVGDSWATLGPRSLTFGETKGGTIIFPGDRKFVSVVPSRSDAINLNIREKSGKARVRAVICKKAEGEPTMRLNKDIIFNYNKESSFKDQDETFLIGGTKNSIVSVILKSQYNDDIAVTNVVPEFEYTIQIDEELR